MIKRSLLAIFTEKVMRKKKRRKKNKKKQKRKANAAIFALSTNAKMKNKSEIPYNRTIPKHG